MNKRSARQIRRAFGPEVGTLIQIVDTRSRVSARILRRGILGRLKWLLFGR